MPKLISVIIPVRESLPHLLQKKLDQLHSGNFKNFEIIVVDDCSPIKIEDHTKNYPLVSRCIRLDNPIPFNMGEAKNMGARLAESNWLAFSDVDVCFTSDELKVLYDKIIQDPTKKVIVGRLNMLVGNEYLIHPHWKDRICCLCLMQKELFDLVGGFSPELAGHYGFDDDLLRYKLKKMTSFLYDENCPAFMDRPDKGASLNVAINRVKFAKLARQFNEKFGLEFTEQERWISKIK